jgi:hypothetical protein
VAPQHLAAPSAFKADHEVPAIGSVDCNSWRGRGEGRRGLAEFAKRSMYGGDQARKLVRRDLIVYDLALDDFGDEMRIDRFSVRHFSHPVGPLSIARL